MAPEEEPIPDVSFVCPECSGTVTIGGDATGTAHSFPLCSRWLKVETLADATQLLREATDKLAAQRGRKGS